MRRLAAFLICLSCMALSGGSAAHAGKRVALVIGIDRYDQLAPLKKAIGDARAIAATLESLGFKVIKDENVTRDGFWRVWQRFISEVEKDGEVILFFSGHGVEIGGVNYLVPRDAPKADSGEDMIEEGSIRFSKLMERLRAKGPRLSLFILDACRDNPFAVAGTKSVGGARGLARVDPPRGAFIMYSADAGQKALDRLSEADADPNSVYTRKLIPLLRKPGLKITELAVRVRAEVYELAQTVQQHEQFPAYYDGMKGDYYLAGAGQGQGQAQEQESAAAGGAAEARLKEAERVWLTLKDTTSEALLSQFIADYEGTLFSRYARARLDEVKKDKLAARIPPGSAPGQRETSRPPIEAPSYNLLNRPDTSARSHIAGVWRGQYFYPDGKRPVEFVFNFETGGAACRGRSEEANTFGQRGAPKLFGNLECPSASLSPGQRVIITKTYDGTGGVSHAVIYSGTVSADLNEITGEWAIGAVKGPFVLRR